MMFFCISVCTCDNTNRPWRLG